MQSITKGTDITKKKENLEEGGSRDEKQNKPKNY